MRQQGRRSGLPWLTALSVALAGAGCNALLDIDHIEFGDQGMGGGGGTGGTGPAPTCDDNMQNGQEEGVDCGGPTCDPCDEDCTNGIDDGGDGLVDCEDPVCAGYQCVPPAPDDWTGPAALYLGSDPAGGCAPGWPDQGETAGAGTLTAPPATCSACSCGSVSGASCGVPGVEIHDTAGCGTPISTVTPPAADVCLAVSASGDVAALGESVPVSGGSCSPGGGVPTLPLVSWEQEALICVGSTESGGCSGAEVCVRRASGTFQPTICIYREGDDPCPDGPYTERTELYRNVNDSRDCADCSCGAPSGVSCSGSTTLYNTPVCNNPSVTVPNDGSTCVAQSGVQAMQFTLDSGPSGGGCSASGGEATGTASGAGRMVVCCLP